MSTMLGSRVNKILPWTQCNCGCRASSRNRRAERRIQKRRDRAAWKQEARGE